MIIVVGTKTNVIVDLEKRMIKIKLMSIVGAIFASRPRARPLEP